MRNVKTIYSLNLMHSTLEPFCPTTLSCHLSVLFVPNSVSVLSSCAGRDRMGPYEAADLTWLTPNPVNNLAVGQYVNNHVAELQFAQQNVSYEELWLPFNQVPLKQRSFLPYVFYESAGTQPKAAWKVVALVAQRDILCDHELFSAYLTITS